MVQPCNRAGHLQPRRAPGDRVFEQILVPTCARAERRTFLPPAAAFRSTPAPSRAHSLYRSSSNSIGSISPPVFPFDRRCTMSFATYLTSVISW